MEPGAPVSAVAGGPPVQIPIGRRACQYDDTALVIGLHELVAGLPTDSY